MDEDSRTSLERMMGSAASRACDTLGRLLHHEVVVGESRVYRADSRDTLRDRLRGHDDQLTITQSAFGAEPVKVSLIVDGHQVRPLLRMLMGYHGISNSHGTGREGAAIDNVEADALRELASVITGSCVRVLAEELTLKGLSMPSMAPHTSLEDKVYSLLPDARSLCAELELKARGTPLKIELMVSLDRCDGQPQAGKPRVEAERAAARRSAVRPART